MAFIFVMTFNGIGAWLTSGMEWVVGAITDALDAGLTAAGVNPVMHAPVIVFLTFVLLYTPCVAAITIAWLVAFVMRMVGNVAG